MKTLRRGDRGTEVKALQQKLNEAGKYGLTVDGDFRAKTYQAVCSFQKSKGLSVDGVVGPKTWSALGVETADVPMAATINKIIVHCAATPEGKEYSSQKISDWHKARNFSYYIDPTTGKKMYVGYHYLIHLDGTIEACRPENIRGCHTSNFNSGSIGVCYIGGVASDGKTPKDTRTPAQKSAILTLLKSLRSKYPKATVHGHREFAAKACPSFDAKKEYMSL